MYRKNNNTSIIIFIVIIFILVCLIIPAFEPSASEKWYQEHKEAIDTYNANHKDDWNGYKGTRRNSWAEDNELKADGYDPSKYKEEHGY